LETTAEFTIHSKKEFCLGTIFMSRFSIFLKDKAFWIILFLSAWTFSNGLPVVALSQELNQPSEISDEELRKFANVKHMTFVYLEAKTGELKKRVLTDPVLSGGARYNEIKAVWGDSSKEEKVKLTDEERNAFRSIGNFQDSLQQTVITYQLSLIKNERMLGEATYLRIVAALRKDPALIEKLNKLSKVLEAER
jgi:hypothetical protein